MDQKQKKQSKKSRSSSTKTPLFTSVLSFIIARFLLHTVKIPHVGNFLLLLQLFHDPKGQVPKHATCTFFCFSFRKSLCFVVWCAIIQTNLFVLKYFLFFLLFISSFFFHYIKVFFSVCFPSKTSIYFSVLL